MPNPWNPLLIRHRGLVELREDPGLFPSEVDVRWRASDDEVVCARIPAEVETAATLQSILSTPTADGTALVDLVPFLFVDVKEADALAPAVALLADAYTDVSACLDVRALLKLPRWAGQPRWAIPAALQRAPNVAVVQCDAVEDTALNQDPASRGYAYWDDFNGSGWRTAKMLRAARLAGLRVILCSDEVYGRPLDVEKLAAEWHGAYGILTDVPEVWERAVGG